MGQTRSKENQENNLLSKKTHCKLALFTTYLHSDINFCIQKLQVTKKEIHDLRHKLDSASTNSSKANITQEVFKEVMHPTL